MPQHRLHLTCATRALCLASLVITLGACDRPEPASPAAQPPATAAETAAPGAAANPHAANPHAANPHAHGQAPATPPSTIVASTVDLCAADAADAPRLVTLSGTVTEIVYALGCGHLIAALDVSSVFPPEAAALPKIGYARKLNAEGILAARPTHIIGTPDVGPPEAMRQLDAAGVSVTTLTGDSTPEAAAERIQSLGALLGRADKAQSLVDTLQADLKRAAERASDNRPRALFLYARGANVLMVSGHSTPAADMLKLAGVPNAVEGFEGFKPLTAEAAVAAAPEVIILPGRGAQSLGGDDAIWSLPGIAQTPAAANKRLILVDDLAFLGFGPRMGQAVLKLQDQLAGEVPAEPTR